METETQMSVTDPNPYLDLVRAFPLRPIRSAEEHDRANSMVYALGDRYQDLKPEEQDYFVVLAMIIEKYEDEIYPQFRAVGDSSLGK